MMETNNLFEMLRNMKWRVRKNREEDEDFVG
jgi:hypothetical protein